MQTHLSSKIIYLIFGYHNAQLEWIVDCLDEGIVYIMYNFHTELLVRLWWDVTEYFISVGNGELDRDQQLASSAIYYFSWAKLLLKWANQFDMKKFFMRLTYVDNRIAFTKQLIKKFDW